jgi:hypothetical protein
MAMAHRIAAISAAQRIFGGRSAAKKAPVA